MWTRNWRERAFAKLSEPCDILVIGGGITGAGIVAEAARLGLRSVLVEANDFASGTSSRSSKLVHGGLRYLRQAQFHVTRESVVERERLLQEAEGLVLPLGFYLAGLQSDRMPTWTFGIGLAIYDLIAKKWAHKRFSAAELMDHVPIMRGARIKGGYRYYDAQTDDARLVLRVLREAVGRGAIALNYARVTGLLRDSARNVVGAVVTDTSGGTTRTAEVRAKVVINATGAWADDLRTKVGAKPKLRPIRGSHLVFSRERLPLNEAICSMHPRDRRATFAIPWEGVTLIGTTDVDHRDDIFAEPAISLDEGEYLIEYAEALFPGQKLTLDDVQSSYAGVRGVVDTGASNPSKESREHVLWSEDGLWTITGGKLTTFRLMAHDALRAVRGSLPNIPERLERARILDDVANTLDATSKLDSSAQARLIGRHGKEAIEIASLSAAENVSLGQSPALWSELRWAARTEGVVHLDDLLLRRVRIGLLLPNGGLGHEAKIREIVQAELGWDDATWAKELARYKALAAQSYGKPQTNERRSIPPARAAS